MILVDDLRSFVDGRSAEVARTSAAGVELLDRCRDQRQLRNDTEGRRYYRRKLAGGKPTMEAMRALKRRLSDVGRGVTRPRGDGRTGTDIIGWRITLSSSSVIGRLRHRLALLDGGFFGGFRGGLDRRTKWWLGVTQHRVRRGAGIAHTIHVVGHGLVSFE